MKKNLISIVILALLVVNIVLSSITLLSVSGTNRKTAALVTDIAAAINLDLGGQTEEEKQEVTVSMADVVTYDITDLTVPLKKGENDEKEHYAMLSVTLSMILSNIQSESQQPHNSPKPTNNTTGNLPQGEEYQ